MALKKDKNVIDHLPRDEKLILFIFLQEDINRKMCGHVWGRRLLSSPLTLFPMGSRYLKIPEKSQKMFGWG